MSNDDRRVLAMLEVSIPLNVDPDAPDDEKRKALDALVDSEDPGEGTICRTSWQVVSDDEPAKVSAALVDQTVPNVALLRTIVEQAGWLWGRLSTEDELGPEELDEIGISFQMGAMSAHELAERIRADIKAGGEPPSLNAQLEAMLREEDEQDA